ncbi:uncharacterized protein LOC128191941 isoform X2 [Crassostrea angulata]|uniref:uncharacterized protein LOC128191941 isoform X2 n=1 Tax=Magallana angulata TaxID=2784310 RepID=UPI0022B109A6|nr:uncharacterized protein LOC128191941 isoform X2 [Crassostrea angulata]
MENKEGKDNSISDKKNRTPNNTSTDRKNNEEKHHLITNKAPQSTTFGMENEKGKDPTKEDLSAKEPTETTPKSQLHGNTSPINQRKNNTLPPIQQGKGSTIPSSENAQTKNQDKVTNPPKKDTQTKEQDTVTNQPKKNTQTEKHDTVTNPRKEDTQTKEQGTMTNPPKKVAAIVLISSSKDISMAKPCDLDKALDSLGLDITSPCVYNDIKNMSICLRDLGIGILAVNLFFFWMILCLKCMPKELKLTFFILIALAALGFFITMMIFYNDVLVTKAAKKDTDFVQIKTTMFNLLEKNYTSDNISSSDAVSNKWNTFFIEYNCCAINQVQGTTNDFDSTPWCTTSGSCQATASQIPKTCCNYVSEEDYGSAPTACHSSVNPGTYKSNCMMAIKLLSVTNIEEYKISLLEISLLIIGTLELCRFAEAIRALVSVTWCDCCVGRRKDKIYPKPKEDEENGNQNDVIETTTKKPSDSSDGNKNVKG